MKLKMRFMGKSRLSAIMPISIVLAAAVILSVVAITNLGNHALEPENEEPIPVVLTDKVGDAEGYYPVDIKEIRLAKEGDNLALTIEVNKNIPTQVGLDAQTAWEFLIDVNKDNFYDFKVRASVSHRGFEVGLEDNYNVLIERLAYELLGPAIELKVQLTKIGGSESFNLRAYSMGGPWNSIFDRVPDNGWAVICF